MWTQTQVHQAEPILRRRAATANFAGSDDPRQLNSKALVEHLLTLRHTVHKFPPALGFGLGPIRG